MNDFDEYLDEDNIETMLEKAVEEIITDRHRIIPR